MNMKPSENNGRLRESNLLMMILKTQSIEPLPNKLGTINSKDSMKTSPSGSKTKPKYPNLSIENSTKTFLRIPVIPSHGPTLRLKVMSISLD